MKNIPVVPACFDCSDSNRGVFTVQRENKSLLLETVAVVDTESNLCVKGGRDTGTLMLECINTVGKILSDTVFSAERAGADCCVNKVSVVNASVELMNKSLYPISRLTSFIRKVEKIFEVFVGDHL